MALRVISTPSFNSTKTTLVGVGHFAEPAADGVFGEEEAVDLAGLLVALRPHVAEEGDAFAVEIGTYFRNCGLNGRAIVVSARAIQGTALTPFASTCGSCFFVEEPAERPRRI